MKKTAKKILEFKQQGKKITALAAYDYSTAKHFDSAGIDILLVGDSLSQVVLGYENTTDVTIDEMKVFTSAVARGAKEALVVADMPFGSYQTSLAKAAENAIEFIKSGASAVKIEGASPYIIDVISHLTQNGIAVMGHLGFTPQFINTIGGHFVAGKNVEATLEILNQAKKLQEAGVFAVVLEMVPKESSKFITERLKVPTIGIGAGKFCDGQILVSDDLLGKYGDFCPKFARKYANLKEIMSNACAAYCKDVQNGCFPSDEESFVLNCEEAEKLESYS